MQYSIQEIQKYTEASFINSIIHPSTIDEIYFDTRKGCFSSNNLFLAIQGPNTDGHDFIAEAYQNLGTRNFLVTKKIDADQYPEANFLICTNIIEATQKLGKHHKNSLSVKTIAITGSNGKTIVKEWIYQLFQDYFPVYRSPASYNSQLGVPLSVLGIEFHHKWAIIEAGISSKGEMARLEEIIQPQIGIITNIGEAHSAGFANQQEKLEEKLELFRNCKAIIYCKDHIIIENTLKRKYPGLKRITWSTQNAKADYYYRVVTKTDCTIISYKEHSFMIPYLDEISIENATNAITCALHMKLSPELISSRTKQFQALKMRIEIKEGSNNCLIINDSYTADLSALSSTIKVLNQKKLRKRNSLIISQFTNPSLGKIDLLKSIAQLINEGNINRVIGIGNDLSQLDEFLYDSIEFNHFNTTEELLLSLPNISFENENVLLKGARKFHLEKIFEHLSKKQHQSFLKVDLEALRHNLSVFRSHLKPETKICVVLKANAYGSGSEEIAHFLSFQHVDYIAVAFIDEGITLRRAGIKTPIMVLNPEEAGFKKMIENELEPAVYSLEQFRNLDNYVEKIKFKIHLKLDTGMHRLGFNMDELKTFLQILDQKGDQYRITSAFSHLVASEDPKEDEFSLAQFKQFEDMCRVVKRNQGYSFTRHILNSHGIIRFPDKQFEMVRLGIGLYGLISDRNEKEKLQTVQELSCVISQIKDLNKGDSVGYNRKYKSDKTRRIATLNIGYADGLPRSAGNGNWSVMIGNKKAPIIGNVCMDMCMIDLDGLDDIRQGDEVTIFGALNPLDSLAEKTGTIAYEILTRLSSRIYRIYSRI